MREEPAGPTKLSCGFPGFCDNRSRNLYERKIEIVARLFSVTPVKIIEGIPSLTAPERHDPFPGIINLMGRVVVGEETINTLITQIGAIIIAIITALGASIPFLWKSLLREYFRRRLSKRESDSFQMEMEYTIRFQRELMKLREKLGTSRAVLWRRENGQYFGNPNGGVPASHYVHFLEDVAVDAPALRQETSPRWPASQFADVWMDMKADPQGFYLARKIDKKYIASATVRFAMKQMHGIDKCVFAFVKDEFGNPIGVLTTSWRKHEKMPAEATIREEIQRTVQAIAYHFASYALEHRGRKRNDPSETTN